MRKRHYPIVDEAENGLDAVSKFNNREQGYDIVFMDISMPVLDGFGATRQIRAVEEARRRKASAIRAADEKDSGARSPSLSYSKSGSGSESNSNSDPNPGSHTNEDISNTQTENPSKGSGNAALIIALTGLASSRDQSEAFTSGVDLFLTKPVAFREVGKMLDNWEANREREVRALGGADSEGEAGVGTVGGGGGEGGGDKVA